MAAVSPYGILPHRLHQTQSREWPGSGLGYPKIKAGSIAKLLTDIPDVVLSILHRSPHLILLRLCEVGTFFTLCFTREPSETQRSPAHSEQNQDSNLDLTLGPKLPIAAL